MSFILKLKKNMKKVQKLLVYYKMNNDIINNYNINKRNYHKLLNVYYIKNKINKRDK